ncbi:MAG: hypothetical protein ABIH03_13495 [Pseudomonadota bacterium]
MSARERMFYRGLSAVLLVAFVIAIGPQLMASGYEIWRLSYQAVGGHYEATPSTLSDGDHQELMLDSNGYLRVAIASTGSAGITLNSEDTDNGAAGTSVLAIAGTDGTSALYIATDSDGQLQVDVLSGIDAAHDVDNEAAGTTLMAIAGTDGTSALYIATDSNGVLQVGDNSTTLSIDDGAGNISIDDGSNDISVDFGGYVPSVGTGVRDASTTRVTVCTDDVVQVGDNSTTLSVDDGAGDISVDFGGYVPSVGTGARDASTQRVTIATDDVVIQALEAVAISYDVSANAVATVTPAVTGGTEYTHICSISASYDGSEVCDGDLNLYQDGTVIGRWQVGGKDNGAQLHLVFTPPIRLAIGSDASITLEASGHADIEGALSVTYFNSTR